LVLPGTLKRLLTIKEWNIGVARVTLEDLARQHPGSVQTLQPRVEWLPKPWFVRCQADPCLLEDRGRLFIYYEEVQFGSSTGRLRAGEFHAGETGRLGKPMIRMPHHAAYPCVFKYGDTFYCTPEMAPSCTVALFSGQTPLGPWRKHSILLQGVRALDSTLFFFGDRWWLFCTVATSSRKDRGRMDNMDNVHIWHSPEPWGPWEPHGLQPAKEDLRSARPAGRPFFVDDVLYRPAQDCWPWYGARVVINRVITLTPDDFVEEPCCYLEPEQNGRYGRGVHTLAFAAGLVVVDGASDGHTLNPYKAGATIIDRLREKRRRGGR
jgi:hypothetical protein